MILQALVSYYEKLTENGTLDKQGWQPVNVHYAVEISLAGELVSIRDLRQESQERKGKLIPQRMSLPQQVKKSSNIASNFLCCNATYMFGLVFKEKPQRARECFKACARLHTELLREVDNEEAAAIIAFFREWNCETASEHPLIQPILKELGAANLVFYINNVYAHTVPAIQNSWQKAYNAGNNDGKYGRCLVTGTKTTIERLHPLIKGVQGAQASGASLVSFNAPAFESYGNVEAQGFNAPVGRYAAFAYGAALNALLSDRRHMLRIGDTTVVSWAEDAQTAYADVFMSMMDQSNEVDETLLNDVIRRLALGQNVNWDGVPLEPQNHYYILGLAPNSARLSVRFFYRDSFGNIAKHHLEHRQRMSIVKPSYEKWGILPLWKMVDETVNPKSKDKKGLPQLSGDILRAILTGGIYPTTLYNQVQLRLRAGDSLSYGKAQIIKAYLLRNRPEYAKNICEESENLEKLCESSNYSPYILGRLFAVLEGLQQSANPGISTTIKDRYFNSACCTPAVVYPTLIRLAQAHLKKLDTGISIYYDRQIQDLISRMDAAYPTRLNIYEQGAFQIGYYHQTQKRYEKKEEKNNG